MSAELKEALNRLAVEISVQQTETTEPTDPLARFINDIRLVVEAARRVAEADEGYYCHLGAKFYVIGREIGPNYDGKKCPVCRRTLGRPRVSCGRRFMVPGRLLLPAEKEK